MKTMTKVNSKNTKAEILAAFEELQREKHSLETEVKKLNKQVNSNSQSSITIKENKPIATANPVKNDVNQIIQNLENLQVGFGSAVSNLSEQLITEASTLAKIQESVATVTQELEELHGLESLAEDTLDNLIESYEENNKQFTQISTQEQERLGQEIQDLHKAWFKEKENYQRELKETNENYHKNLKRDQQEYEYNLKLTRQLSEEEYQQQQQNFYKELETLLQQQEKAWQQREETISKQEKEYAEAKEKVELFDQELETKIKQAKEEGKGIGIYQAKVKADLRNREIEGERKNYELRITSLEDTIENNQARIESLSQQLDAALKQVQDLAVKAIEGTSNRNSYEAMKEIALEQAKNQPKGK